MDFSVVTTLDDEFDLTNDVISLREAIWYVSKADTTITFSDSLFTEESPTATILLDTQLLIDKPLTIDGAGRVTLDGQEKTRIIYNTSDLTLDGLTLTNGKADNGGAIWSNGSINIFSSKISDNRSTKVGAGIYNQGMLNTDDCQFDYNIAGGDGGGIYSVGTTNLKHTILSRNEAWDTSSAGGGGIYVLKCSTQIDACQIFQNKSMDPSGSDAAGAGIQNSARAAPWRAAGRTCGVVAAIAEKRVIELKIVETVSHQTLHKLLKKRK